MTPEFLIILCIVAVVMVVYFYFSYDVGFNLADEGYLWYGTLRLLDGEVPVRDFRAYDPGRYIWCALFSKVFGKGLLSIRIGLIAGAWIGLSFGAYSIWLATQNWVPTICLPMIGVFWMWPIHKILDNFLPLVSVFLFYLALSFPGYWTIFFAAFWVGLSILMGLNHFVYGSISIVGVIIYGVFKTPSLFEVENLGLITVGVICGVIPFLLFLIIPGTFYQYFNKKVLRILKRKGTNLKKEVPLLWNIPWAKIKDPRQCRIIKLLSILSILFPLVYLIAILICLVSPPTPATDILLVSSMVGISYLNHYLSRADLPHLAGSSMPFLVCVFLIGSLNSFIGLLLIIFLVLITIPLFIEPLIDNLNRSKYGDEASKLSFDGTSNWIPAPQARHLEGLVKNIHNNCSEKGNVFIAPTMVGLFPLLNKKSEIYDTFPVYPAQKEEQLSMIDEIKAGNIELGVVQNVNLDGRVDLRFEHTYPLVWRFLLENYQMVELIPGTNNLCLFKRQLPISD